MSKLENNRKDSKSYWSELNQIIPGRKSKKKNNIKSLSLKFEDSNNEVPDGQLFN